MLENLNDLEKIGLAFLSGIVAGQSLVQAENEEDTENEEEIEAEEGEIKNTKHVVVGTIEGEKAEKFMKMMKDLGVE